MSPLLLYESILNGDIIRMQSVPENHIVPLHENYPDIQRMLQYCEDKHDIVYLNKKYTFYHERALRKRLRILRKTKNTREVDEFIWNPTAIEIRQFITEEKDYFVSKNMKSSTECMFYCEMTVKPHKAKRYGAISLTLFRLPSKQNQATISCHFYCEQMDFYVRFEDTIIKIDGDENNAKQTAFFYLEDLQNAIERKQSVEWNIVVIHKDIKRVSVAAYNAKNIAENMMTQHELDAARLHDELTRNSQLQHLPLHRFTKQQICDVVTSWIFNDIQFKKQMRTIINLFA
eukprot:1123240_1